MGGSSSINGQMALRGDPADYDAWEAMGARGWRWETVLPYFKKLEWDMDFDGPQHGKEGRIPIRRLFPEVWSGHSRAAARAFAAAGYQYRPDMNEDFAEGYAPVPFSNAYDRRVSAAIGYLDAVTRQRDKPDHHGGNPGQGPRLRGPRSGRRRGREGRRRRGPSRAPGHPQRRRASFAGLPHARRHRSGGAPQGPRHRGPGGGGRRRPKPLRNTPLPRSPRTCPRSPASTPAPAPRATSRSTCAIRRGTRAVRRSTCRSIPSSARPGTRSAAALAPFRPGSTSPIRAAG